MKKHTMKDHRRQFFTALKESNFPDKVVKVVIESLPRRIEAFLREPENQGPMGRRANGEAASRVKKTLKHLTNAVRHAGHDDPTVRRKAKALIRSARCRPFEELEISASRFHGGVMRAGQNREEWKRRERRRRIPFRGGDLVEVNSSRQLESVGRQLGNCCAHKRGLGQEYHEDLRNKSAEFWVFQKDGTVGWLAQINRETRTVQEILGHDNEDPELGRQEALELLRVLEVTADDCDKFSAVGAYSIFVTGSPEMGIFGFDEQRMRVWCSPGGRRSERERLRIVIAIENKHNLFERKPRRSAPRRRASLAEWSAVAWHAGAMTEGQFIDLLLNCPEVADWIRAMCSRDWGSDEP